MHVRVNYTAVIMIKMKKSVKQGKQIGLDQIKL